MIDFTGLDLAPSLLRAVGEEGYTTPTPIQAQTIPALMAGRDVLGIAQTGTGKTAAFALPILHRLSTSGSARAQRGRPRTLILAPTRELAGQIGDSFSAYGKHLGLGIATVFGGVSIRAQIARLGRGVHVLVATPGRLMDLMNQGAVDLGSVEMFVLDEADRMLDMGFVRDVRRIAATLPTRRQTIMFSATMPNAVSGLAEDLLDDPVRVEVAPQATTAERVDQRVLFVTKDKKRALITDLMADRALSRVLIFTRTKHGADRVARHLDQAGISADAIHGNKSQNNRLRALNGFRSGKVRALVATDIAARGIDVDGVTHVINFELPNDPENYVHRIGRTARAGASGIALSFCDAEERAYLRDIEKVIRQPIEVTDDHAFHAPEIANDPRPAKPPQKQNRGGQGSGRRRGGRSRGRQGGAARAA